jgi:hypothetical protein
MALLVCPSTCIQVIAFTSVFDVAVDADINLPQTSAPNPPLALGRPPGRTPHTRRVSLRQVRCLKLGQGVGISNTASSFRYLSGVFIGVNVGPEVTWCARMYMYVLFLCVWVCACV